MQLTKLTDTLFSQLFLYEQKIKEGQLSQAQAQQQAVAYIKTLRYGQGDYFWINDHQPKMIMHPTNPKLDGQDLSTNQDKVGNFLFVDMVKAVKANAAGGFVHYFWPKPNSDTPVENYPMSESLLLGGGLLEPGFILTILMHSLSKS
nr:cache domain-containing protein [Thiomicrorhabdus aquaedulcis]